MDTAIIRQEALSLPPDQRAKLAEELLSSLEVLSSAELDQLSFAEAARRADEIDRGKAVRYSSAEVQSQARSLLR